MPSADTSAPIADWDLSVTGNRKICEHHYLLELALPAGRSLEVRPGQFFHLLCDPDSEEKGIVPLTLRRPFSIHDIRYPGFHRRQLARAESASEQERAGWFQNASHLRFLYRVVGTGTDHLAGLPVGTILKGIGPCGNGFSIAAGRTAVLVAGGIGIAPLKLLAEHLRAAGNEVLVYFGAVRREMLLLALDHSEAAPRPEADEEAGLLQAVCGDFAAIGANVLQVCTDDGSAGEKALVTELLEQGIRGGCVPRENVTLYACGPAGMLAATAAIAERHGLPCQVSLEERMACGIGACYACSCRIRGADGAVRRKRVCRDGPVFAAKDVLWKD